jgi:copper chaperone NosL
MISRRHALSVLTLALVAGACKSNGPRSLIPGEDACAYCRMSIDDIRFGAMVLTARGRMVTFDSIECAAAYVSSLPSGQAPRAIWIANAERPAQFVDAARAQFLHGSTLRSPMGRELAAFAADANLAALQQLYGGRALTWTEVLLLTATPLRSSQAARFVRSVPRA